MAQIVLAGGCFWGMEAYVNSIPGVQEALSGYANGYTQNPTYEEVCSGKTGYAEAVRVTYDPAALTLSFLLALFFEAIDPTLLNRQGADEGTQYRTGIYYMDAADMPIIQEALRIVQARHEKPLVTEIAPLGIFYPAEDYHQQYMQKHPGGYCHIHKPVRENVAHAKVDPQRYKKPDAGTIKAMLKRLSYAVTQEAYTERAFSSPYHAAFSPGIYVDAVTGEPLFDAADQYDAGCGWPSFTKPIDPYVVWEKTDTSHNMLRTELVSRVGQSHLGHVFNDGLPEKGGRRYCINGAALRFIPEAEMEEAGYGYLRP